MSDSIYIHGTNPEEQGRLTTMNAMLNARSLAALRVVKGDRVLDVGSGLAQLTRAIAREAGRAVVGIERSDEQLREAIAQARADGEENLLDLRQGDALALPLADEEWGSFDLAHTRFLLEHLADPLAAVRAMARAVKPGGRVVLEDDDHGLLRLWPEAPGFAPLWEAYMRAFDRGGGDAFIGRRLVWLLHEAGLRPLHNDWLFFGGCCGDDHFGPLVDNLIGVIVGARDRMVDGGFIPVDSYDRAIEELGRWRTRPDAAIWYASAWAEGESRTENGGRRTEDGGKRLRDRGT